MGGVVVEEGAEAGVGGDWENQGRSPEVTEESTSENFYDLQSELRRRLGYTYTIQLTRGKYVSYFAETEGNIVTDKS